MHAVMHVYDFKHDAVKMVALFEMTWCLHTYTQCNYVYVKGFVNLVVATLLPNSTDNKN